MKDDDSLLFPSKSSKKRSSLADIFDDGTNSGGIAPILNPHPITQVYRAETTIPICPPPRKDTEQEEQKQQSLRADQQSTRELNKADILFGAMFRTCERNRRLIEEEDQKRDNDLIMSQVQREFNICDEYLPDASVEEPSPGTKSDKSIAELEREEETLSHKMTQSCWVSRSSPTSPRMRSYSENITGRKDDLVESLSTVSDDPPNSSDSYLQPLDLSFDQDISYWSDHDHQRGNRSPLSSVQSPTTDYFEDEEDFEDNLESSNTDKENLPSIPTSNDKDTFRQSFASATSMVFHRRTGLPLTSSPAPLRKGPKSKFDFDSTLTSPNDIKRALFCKQTGRAVSPIKKTATNKKRGQKQILSVSAPAKVVTASNLLGNFEESVLNGRLEPHSTVEGFTAEIGASGSFHPKHLVLPVTVFFYTLCDNTTISSPYLGISITSFISNHNSYVKFPPNFYRSSFFPNLICV